VKRPDTADPLRAGLMEELRALRRGSGQLETRLGALPWIVDSLGHGSLVRAAERLRLIRDEHAADPETDIGAFYWLADYGEHHAGASLEQRLTTYATACACDARTALRRSDRGIRELAGMLRDYNETERPVGMVSIFQSGTNATVVIDLWLSYESFREPEVQLNGEPIEREPFVLHHHNGDPEGRYRARLILDPLPLNVDVEPYEPCLTVRVLWDMPIMPVWQLTGWVADPRFAVRLQTFRQRAAEVTLTRRTAA
jgi:hypothetical protein